MLFSKKPAPRIAEPDLWARIEAHEFDDRPGELGFRDRLAAETGWRKQTVEEAIAEYRRFAYLWATAAHPVTPSIAVDIVWHLHLAYSRNYWDRFCRHALGRPMHHEPTSGTAEDRARYRQQYEATLATYEEVFGECPPARYWPDADRRFAAVAQPRLYSPATHTAVPNRIASNLFPALAAAGVYGGATALGWTLVSWFAAAIAVLATLTLLVKLVFGGASAQAAACEVGISISHVSSSGDGDGDGGCGGGCGGD